LAKRIGLRHESLAAGVNRYLIEIIDQREFAVHFQIGREILGKIEAVTSRPARPCQYQEVQIGVVEQ
jgi:hypothetical protein